MVTARGRVPRGGLGDERLHAHPVRGGRGFPDDPGLRPGALGQGPRLPRAARGIGAGHGDGGAKPHRGVHSPSPRRCVASRRHALRVGALPRRRLASHLRSASRGPRPADRARRRELPGARRARETLSRMAHARAASVGARSARRRSSRVASARGRARWGRRLVRALLTAPLSLRLALGAVAIVLVWLAVNAVYQVVRKPTELFFPVSGTLAKTPAETWRQYGQLFERHST